MPKKRDIKSRFLTYFDKGSNDECWNWGINRWKDKDGCGKFYMYTINGKDVYFRSSRAAWTIFIGPIPDGLWVLHKCDNPSCVNPAHLFLGTPKDNAQDCLNKCRWNAPKAENHSSVKLTSKQIEAIRLEYSCSNISQKALGLKYGIAQQYVHKIVTFKTRKSG